MHTRATTTFYYDNHIIMITYEKLLNLCELKYSVYKMEIMISTS